MRVVTMQQRRRSIARRHHLAGDDGGPEQVSEAVLALHATDPSSVYLSVLARSAGSTVAHVAAAMYERRTLVRWMAMRRTLFVFDRRDVPTVQAAISSPLAEVLHRRLVSQLRRNGTDPPLEEDADRWVRLLEDRVEDALRTRGVASGAELSRDVPALRTSIRAVAPSDRPATVTSPLLTILSARGRIVRGIAVGTWTTRHHRWEPLDAWWPEGMPEVDVDGAQTRLAQRWLERFGPATVDDLQWWMGWTKTLTRQVLSRLPVEEVDLHGHAGIDLLDADGRAEPDAAPVAVLLPALDPTPMGWKDRDWFLAVDPRAVFDRTGNIGPTVWWDGEAVGAWAVAPTGEVRTAVTVDRGNEALAAVDAAAARLQRQLDGTVVTPVFPTELERSLRC